jgi:hypothetical protein
VRNTEVAVTMFVNHVNFGSQSPGGFDGLSVPRDLSDVCPGAKASFVPGRDLGIAIDRSLHSTQER